MTVCKQTTSLSNLHWPGKLTQPCQFRSLKLPTWLKVLCRRILQKPKSYDILTLDHQSESQRLFNLNLVLTTRLPVTTYLQMWRWVLKVHYTHNCIIICYKWIIPKQKKLEVHTTLKRQSGGPFVCKTRSYEHCRKSQYVISSSVCQILLLLGKAKWKGKSKHKIYTEI